MVTVLDKFIDFIEKQKVAFHKHEGFPEHPVAVKDHPRYFERAHHLPVPKKPQPEIDVGGFSGNKRLFENQPTNNLWRTWRQIRLSHQNKQGK